MLYEIQVQDEKTKNLKKYNIDDEVLLQDQLSEIKELIAQNQQGEVIDLHDCSVVVYKSGRIIINKID